MKWLLKAAVQKMLSGLPSGDRLNFVLQRHVTRGLPHSRDELLGRFKVAVQFEHAGRVFGAGQAQGLRGYEIGPGWDLGVALSLYMLGVERQTLVDLRPLLRWELVNHTIRIYNQHYDRLQALANKPLRPLPSGEINSARDLERFLGISYLAPADARQTGLEPASFDLVGSCHVLEHIPAQDLPAVLSECRRLVSPRGVVCHLWNMQDHFADFDASLSAYNFLGLNQGAWRMVNSGLQYQNRLRLPDYMAAFEQAGLKVVHRWVHWPSDQDLAALAGMRLASQFQGRYSLQDLGARMAMVVCKPA